MTSIIVTVGPKSIKPQILENLIDAGADSFRINLSHSNKENLHKYFDILKKSGIIPAIDTQGAQLRVIDTNLKDKLNPGKMIKLIFGVKNVELIEKDDLFILLNHPEAFDQILEGDIMKVDFDGLALQINSKVSPYLCKAEVLSSGSIVLNRAVDINSKSLSLSTLTDFDKYAIDYALSNGSKEIYASFISSASDVNYVRNFLGDNVSLIAKIETSLGVSNVKEIMHASDKILIDRGDLSREITIPSVPLAVFNILRLAKDNYDVLIATNVLDSMMYSNLPSRAEISDIFNHLSAGASGIVLAAEVAIGNNPVSSTAFLKYLIEVFNNYENGLHGIGKIKKPSKYLVGEELFNWL